MRKIHSLVTTSLLLSAIGVNAAEFYPAIPNRIFGSNQDVGSCLSESYVTAIEHKLAQYGVNFKTSLQHAHASVWKNADLANNNDVGLIRTAINIDLTNRYETILPDYVLPEDLSGVDLSSLGTSRRIGNDAPVAGNERYFRPKIEDIGIYDGTFAPNTNPFSTSYYSFVQGKTNSSSADNFISLIKSGATITLSFDADLFSEFDNYTGLMAEPYQANTKFFDEENHSVAVVGYDDELGGIILRNTWNSSDNIIEIGPDKGSPEQIASLAKFRLKIAPRNLPGYYLVPYQFIRDLVSHSTGGFYLLQLDFGRFANTYQQNASKFEVINTFYSCTSYFTKRKIVSLKKHFTIYDDPSQTKEKRAAAFKLIKTVIYDQMSQVDPIFYFAKQTRKVDGTIDRVKEFHEGKFANYYCGNILDDPQTEFWPKFGRDPVATTGRLIDFERRLTADNTDIKTWFEFFRYVTSEVN